MIFNDFGDIQIESESESEGSSLSLSESESQSQTLLSLPQSNDPKNSMVSEKLPIGGSVPVLQNRSRQYLNIFRIIENH